MSLWDNVKKFAQPYADDEYDDYDEDEFEDDYDEPHSLSAQRRRTVEPILQGRLLLRKAVGRTKGAERKKRKELSFCLHYD